MQHWRRWIAVLLIALLAVGIGIAISTYFYLDFVVDYWWFDSLGYSHFFFLTHFYRYLVLTVVTLFFFLIFFSNFWAASRYLGTSRSEIPKSPESKRSYKDIVEMFRTGSMTVYTPLSLILAIFIAYPLFEKWELFLFYIFGPDAGFRDPAFGNDVSFYLFSYPIYILLQQRLLFVLAILIGASLLLYWIERRVLSKSDDRLPKGARIHLNILAVLFIALFVWTFFLQRFGLLYYDNHMPLFHGPGYTEVNITLPLIWISLVLWILAGIFVLLFINRRMRPIPAAVFVVLFAAAFFLLRSNYLEGLVQKYMVVPNELAKETPYIANNIEATLAAYRLTDVESRDFDIGALPWTQTAREIERNIPNIPVWDRPLLDTVYDQLQGIRPYYNFTGADVDRYNVAGRYQQVNLAAREINMDKLPDYARNWINRRFQYTHGFGLVMTPAAQSAEQMLQWFIRGITPTTAFDFPIENPAIYYGLENLEHVIAPNDVGEVHFPKEDSFVMFNYDGQGGIPISNLFRKLVFAAYFKDRNIFFTTKTNNESKVLFRRNVPEAIRTLTPFFELDADPYLVVTPEGLFWIQDAYVSSKWYPYSARFLGPNNYIRNSVKIVVSAYHGTIDFYIADPSDPIITAYSRMFPGLLKPIDEMPKALVDHIRYPVDLFRIQMAIYKRYHQTDPGTFYRDEDLWEFAERAGTGEGITTEPYYVTLNLIDPEVSEFLLLSPMSPRLRPNLRALAIARCDGDNYGDLIVYNFPKGEQVYGPAQINALIDQDPTISEQFTLWNQAGSQVNQGRMIILPIGDMVFFIQPVYLSAVTELKIPQLTRLIVSEGSVVVMDVSLEKAFARIEQLVNARNGARPSGAEKEAAPVPEGAGNPPKQQVRPETPDQPQENKGSVQKGSDAGVDAPDAERN